MHRIAPNLVNLSVPIGSVIPYPGNARLHADATLAESLQVNQQYRPLVVQSSTRFILAGNGTWKAALALGWDEIAATVIDCDDATAKRILLVDNRASDLATYDDAALLAILREVGDDLPGTGYSAEEYQRLLAELDVTLADPIPPEPKQEPITVDGHSLVQLINGDARQLPLDNESVHAVVTDPPYGLAFMGKSWDSFNSAAFQQWSTEWATEALRVLKPGGHLLAFGGTRTYHRLCCAIEDAGFEIRDSIGCLSWIYGQGFPKSLDVSKAIDNAAGAERERLAPQQRLKPSAAIHDTGFGSNGWAPQAKDPITAAAAEWQGWGTALKPAWEPIIVARKPLGRAVAGNVLEHGTGALNVDGCRVGTTVETWPTSRARPMRQSDLYFNYNDGGSRTVATGDTPAGRWPTNQVLVHHPDCGRECVPECHVAEMDRQSGISTSPPAGSVAGRGPSSNGHGDSGGASRFFPQFRYEPKAPSNERPVGESDGKPVRHPTVKPVDLMRWLVRLVTPAAGTVLDPFAGSGSTLHAAVAEGIHAIGVELDSDYCALIRQRLGLTEGTDDDDSLPDGPLPGDAPDSAGGPAEDRQRGAPADAGTG